MQYLKPFSILCTAAFLAFTGCKDEEIPDITNEEELITTLTLEFTDELTGITRQYTFRDVDGPGGAAPDEFDTIKLDPNSDYNVYAYILNESVTPAEDLTEEIYSEADEHQMFYTVTGADVNFIYIDFDFDGHPIGLHMTASTGDASVGSTTVTLKHQPGNKDGNITTGETDVEVTFITEIE